MVTVIKGTNWRRYLIDFVLIMLIAFAVFLFLWIAQNHKCEMSGYSSKRLVYIDVVKDK